MNYRAIIPNLFTSLNLVFGMCSILSTYDGDLTMGSLFILIALVADGLDGRTARFFGVAGEMGKEMDSLCDLVSFGAAPAFLAYVYHLHEFGALGWAAAIFFAVCGMGRLARFNVNANVVHGYFMGLAIPAGGCLVATSTWLFRSIGFDPHVLGLAYPIAFMVVAYLMFSRIHYPNFKGDGGEPVYLASKMLALVLFAMCLFFGRNALPQAVLFAVFVTYAVSGIFNYSLALMQRN